MSQLDRRDALKAIAGTAGLGALSHTTAATAAEPRQPRSEGGTGGEIKIPASLKAEHDELHEELVRATKAGGKTGEAARAVAKVLQPHFVKEEELAMPRSASSGPSPTARPGRRWRRSWS